MRQSFFAGRALAGRGRDLLLLSLAKLELTFLFASRAAAMSYRAIRCCFGDVFSNVQWGWVEFDKEFCIISCCWGDVFLIFVFHYKNRLLHQISQ